MESPTRCSSILRSILLSKCQQGRLRYKVTLKRSRFLNAVGLNPAKYLYVKVLLKCLKYLEVIKLFCMVCLV